VVIDVTAMQKAKEEAEEAASGSMWDQIPELEDDGPEDLSDSVDIAVEARQDAPPATPWPYAYYLWRSQCTDTDRLSKWQHRVGTALARRGIRTQFAVGWMRHPDPVVVRSVGYRVVAFLGDNEQPTKKLARRAASQMVEHLRNAA
jgi:hypothetical protein